MTPVPTPTQVSVTASGDLTFAEAAVLTFKSTDHDPARGANPDACLVHVYPPDSNTGRRYRLGATPVVIGRGEDCGIRNPDASISRYHARIVPGSDGRYSVTDLGSTNGTFVNNASRRESALRDGDYLRVGNCIYRFLAGGDIEAEYHEEIYRLTILDGLTQVYNRRYFTEFLEREATRAARHQRSLAVILLGIDQLKGVNDTLGALAADMALRELCARARLVIRSDELLARTGGAEFAIVLPEADADSARSTAERVRLVVETQPFACITRTFRVTISAGVAVLPQGEGSPAGTLHGLAAANLARAQAAGGNRVVVS
jgi:diguanylate cyclase (GGDEF)-like protein